MKTTLNNSIMYALASLLVVSSLAGCASSGGEDGGAAPAQKKPDPITLRLFNLAGSSKEQFDFRIKAHIEKKYPHITMELVNNVKGTTLQELAAANNLPDMVLGKTSDQDLMLDMNPLIKKYNFDMNRIKPVMIDTFKFFTDTNDKTLFLPLVTNMHVLQYNKDIFDRFGVPYPKDGMTWDETYELAKRLARTDGGVKYFGFNVRANLNFQNPQITPQMSLEYYDPKTDKGAINSDGWKRYFANFTRFFTIDGNEVTKQGNQLSDDLLFRTKRQVAMYASHPIWSQLDDDFNWDQVALPTFSDAPRIGSSANANGLGITRATKHPDDAFLAIQAVLTDEAQLFNATLGWESILKDDAKQQAAYAKDVPKLKGKNIKAFFYNSYAPTPKVNDYNFALKTIPYTYFTQIVWGEKDLNTALRDAEEAMNKKILEIKATKK